MAHLNEDVVQQVFETPIEATRSAPRSRAASDPRAVARRWVEALSAHDLEAAVACFAPNYHDEAPARRGEVIQAHAMCRRTSPRCSVLSRISAPSYSGRS